MPPCAHLQIMPAHCSSISRAAILFVLCSESGMESASDGGMAVGIKSSLSACVPLIRLLASAMQWAWRKVFDTGRMATVHDFFL